MRGENLMGRFDSIYEVESIGVGIDQDLQNPVGQYVDWWVFDPTHTKTDPVYDVGDYVEIGRQWRNPFRVPVVMATIVQGSSYQNERGFYTKDNLSMVINAVVMYELLPDMAYTPDRHLADRITYRGKLFTPTLIYPKGHIQDHLVVTRIDAEEVKPEEVVNDPQFAAWVV